VKRLAFLTLFALVCGCSTPGLLYTNITLPLTPDMDNTPRASIRALRSQRTIREPFTRGGIRAEWAGFAPGEAARRGGIDVVHYADLRQQSVLGGIWGQTTAVVYGSRNGDGTVRRDDDPR
jgi:hypothetical protein